MKISVEEIVKQYLVKEVCPNTEKNKLVNVLTTKGIESRDSMNIIANYLELGFLKPGVYARLYNIDIQNQKGTEDEKI